MAGEVILELADEMGESFSNAEVGDMFRVLARGTAESVTEYARQRDKQLSRESARHFSFIAHELRTPLQTAQLAVAFLPDDENPATARLKRAHEQLVSLVDNALVHARLIAEPELEKALSTGRTLVDAALSNAEGLAEQQGVHLVVECEDFEIEADRRLVISALTNLVINGVKFSPSGKQVVLHARAQEERVLFEIADSCGGLPQGAIERMIQPFVQSGSNRSGFGLGLMIVKQAVEAHGGAVRVQDRPGRGCCFVVELPRLQSRMSRDRVNGRRSP